MKRIRNHILAFVIAFALWWLLTWDRSTANILAGIAVAIVAAIFFGDRMNTGQNRFHLIRLFWFLVFIPVFLWEMLKANIDVAYRVLHPQLPINPGLVKVKTGLKREISLAFLANAITLTPGNTTVDIIGDAVFVHCIDVDRPAQVIASRFENIIARIFE